MNHTNNGLAFAFGILFIAVSIFNLHWALWAYPIVGFMMVFSSFIPDYANQLLFYRLRWYGVPLFALWLPAIFFKSRCHNLIFKPSHF